MADEAAANASAMTGAEVDEMTEATLWSSLRSDLTAKSGLAAIGAAALTVWLIFQWGFGNDAVLPSIVATTFDAVDDGETWGRGITAAVAGGAAGGLFWAITQALDAIVVLVGIRLLPAFTHWASTTLRRKGWVKPYADMSWPTRWIIAYAAGASAVVLVDVFATDRPGLKSRRSMIVAAVALSAGTIAIVAGFIAFLAALAVRVPSTEGTAELVIRFAKNPLTWVTIYLIAIGVAKLRKQAGDGAAPS